jgi:hypothetical protein
MWKDREVGDLVPVGKEIFLLYISQIFSASYPMDTGALSPGVKPPRREARLSTAVNAEVNETWIFLSTTPTRLHDVVLS